MLPLREAKTEDISPSFLGPLLRCWAKVAVSRVRICEIAAPNRGVRRRVEGIMARGAKSWDWWIGKAIQIQNFSEERRHIYTYLLF